VAVGQGLAEIRVRAEIQRGLTFLVFQFQVGAVRRQVAGNERATLFILALSA